MSWPQPDPDRAAAHRAKYYELQAAYKDIETRLKAEGKDYGQVLRDPDYDAAFMAWRHHYNCCAQCGSDDTRVENYSMMWHDGDIICNVCGRYVRGYDAG